MRKLIIIFLITLISGYLKAQVTFSYADSCKKYDGYMRKSFNSRRMWELLPASYWANDSNKYKSFFRVSLEVFQNFKNRKRLYDGQHQTKSSN